LGWNVRRPEDGPKPHWARGEGDSNDSDEAPSDAEPLAIEADAGSETTEAATPADTASADEPVEDLAADDEPSPRDAPESEVAHDFWSEFATPDPDADGADAGAEPEAMTDQDAAPTAAETDPDEVQPDRAETPPILEERRDPDRKPVVPEGVEPFRRRSSERTVAPWSWPLAEAESVAAPTPSTAAPMSPFHLTDVDVPATVNAEPASPEPNPGADEGFFQRDEPVGSQFVDFDEVRKELVRIGVVWLGESNAVPVTALLAKTRSTIDDFVATIDTIRGLNVEGQDPASIQAMAREMHQQAAERLCGA
jgi:hypothetical protein